MNKTKRKGFTLVELLAVIVILAVVILIAVTAVVPRMNNAKKKAFIDEALVYLKAGKEMLVSDNAHGCYLISDLGNYVKQDKDGYSGTIFISDSRVSLNLTNGKYYLKTDNNRNISDTDLVESAPNDFLSTCSAPTNPTNYSITYVLNGGSVSGTNPSSYTSYSDDIHLINPTRSGYRFVGWSGGKNLFNEDNYLDRSTFTLQGSYYYKFIDLSPGVTYKMSVKRYNGFDGVSKSGSGYYSYLLVTTRTSTGTLDVNNTWSAIAHCERPNFTRTSFTYTPTEDSKIVVLSKDLSQSDFNKIWESTDVQLEKGTVVTEYEAYMNNNTNVTIPKGSSGNRTYIANWEAI